jgi:arylformamidase
MSTRAVDLSHTVEPGMTTHKGRPLPAICGYLTREASCALCSGGTGFHSGKIEMAASTGAPFRRYADGLGLAELPLNGLANLAAVVVRHAGPAIGAKALSGLGGGGNAVLLHTGWDRYWRTGRYLEGHLFPPARDAAGWLARAGAALAGSGSHNIGDTRDGTRPAHSIRRRARIPICGHRCGPEAVPATGGRRFAGPVKVRAMGTFPVRAFARTESA